MLKVGVIGCGGMGRDHIKRLVERTQGATVTAVADMVDQLLDQGAAIAGSSSLRALRTRTHCSPPSARASASSVRSPSARPPRTASPSSMPR